MPSARTALVVDDDPEVRATVSGLLEVLGWCVHQLEDGAEVARTAVLESPDLIVMDVMMPLKSGFDAFEELRRDAATALIPVILLSAINQYELGAEHSVETIGKALDVPYPEGFLEKPVDLRALEAAIRQATGA